MNSRTRNRLLAAVAAAVPVIALTLPAPAQQRVNNGGRALDANTRVGSDGSNDRNNNLDNRGPTYTGNQLVTGNVTGGRSFRGPVGYSDPLEFRGPSASFNSDRFVRDSVGAPTRTNPSVGYGPTTGFYGDRRATPPPPGYRPEGFTGGLYNTGASQQTITAASPYATAQSWSAFSNTRNLTGTGSTFFQGGVDQNNQPQLLSASPLYGVLPLNTVGDAAGDRLGMPARDRLGLSPADRDRMRQELNDAGREGAVGDENADQQQQQPDPNNLAQPLEAQSLNNAAGAVQGGSTNSASAARAAGRNQGNVGEGNRSGQIQNQLNADRVQGAQGAQGVQSTLVVPPAQQSKQYAELEARFRSRQASGPVTPDELNAQQRMLQKQRAADAGGQPGAAAPGQQAAPQEQPRQALPVPRRQPPAAAPDKPEAQVPDVNQPAAAAQPPAAERPAPLRVKSLADGVEAKGLRDLLVGAEELMRKGSYREADQKYTQAEQVAPNNPLIRLGRAHVALGSGRYVSAEQRLREAIDADPALLMGQYDLESFIGKDRVTFVVKELQQISRSEASSPRPMILLAYIAYGTPGLESAAADYVDQAAKRAGRPDRLIEAMRKHWSMPAAEGQAAPPAQEKPAPEKPAPEKPAAEQPATTTEQPAPAPEQPAEQPAPAPEQPAPEDLNK